MIYMENKGQCHEGEELKQEENSQSRPVFQILEHQYTN